MSKNNLIMISISCFIFVSMLLLNSCSSIDIEENTVSCLTFTSISGESQVGYKSSDKIDTSEIFYSLDSKNWIQWDGTYVKLAENEKLYVKNLKSTLSKSFDYFKFTMTGKIDVSGDVSSMINYGELSDYCFSLMFASCDSLINAKDLLLPSKSLSSHCYFMMFYNCSNLSTAPTLSAMELGDGCYHSMFNKCSTLTKAPKLPATELKPYCYNAMFSECRNLVEFPELPAKTMSVGCYENMFSFCDGIKIALDLPATKLADSCYSFMFAECHNLIKVNDLPAKKLAYNCYSYMFYKCSNLEDINIQYCGEFTDEYFYNWVDSIAERGKIYYSGFDTKRGASFIPEGFDILIKDGCLNFISLKDNSYVGYVVNEDVDTSGIMYSTDRTNWKAWDGNEIKLSTNDIIYVKNTKSKLSSKNSTFSFKLSGEFSVSGNLRSMLNNENVTDYCYRRLFYNCEGLIYASDLEMPSLYLSKKCYSEMFLDCKNLISAPLLYAKNLSEYCYEGMFKNCHSLMDCPILPAINLSKYCYANMFENCTSITTLHMLPADKLVDGCYKSMYSGCKKLNYIKLSYDKSFLKIYFENWLKGVSSTGDMYYGGRDHTRGNSAIPKDWNVAEPFAIYSIGGNASIAYEVKGLVDTSKIYYSRDRKSWTKWNGSKLNLKKNNKLYIKNENFSLSVNISNCLKFIITGEVGLSGDISSLINYGTLNKTSNYNQLFKECEGIVEAKDLILSSLNLSAGCYADMFYKCNNLKSAPQIKARKLAKGCYSMMFAGCFSLETAPDLMVDNLELSCYAYMFYACKSLKSIKIAYEGDFNEKYTYEWLNGVALSGNFYYNGNDFTRSSSAIPVGWNVIRFDKDN